MNSDLRSKGELADHLTTTTANSVKLLGKNECNQKEAKHSPFKKALATMLLKCLQVDFFGKMTVYLIYLLTYQTLVSKFSSM